MDKVGVFSGTFDPPHAGHQWFVEYALNELGFEKVIVLVEPQPRHKEGISDFKHRVEMTRLLFQDNQQVEVNPVTTVTQHTFADTLSDLEEFTANKEVWLLVGGDVFEFVPKWHEISKYKDKVSFLVGLRSEDDGEVAVELLQGSMSDFSVKLVASEQSAVSSTKIRADTGSSFAGKNLAENVRQYIIKHSLYEN